MSDAPPDWYPDPERPNTERWWDGTQWGPIRPVEQPLLPEVSTVPKKGRSLLPAGLANRLNLPPALSKWLKRITIGVVALFGASFIGTAIAMAFGWEPPEEEIIEAVAETTTSTADLATTTEPATTTTEAPSTSAVESTSTEPETTTSDPVSTTERATTSTTERATTTSTRPQSTSTTRRTTTTARRTTTTSEFTAEDLISTPEGRALAYTATGMAEFPSVIDALEAAGGVDNFELWGESACNSAEFALEGETDPDMVAFWLLVGWENLSDSTKSVFDDDAELYIKALGAALPVYCPDVAEDMLALE